MSDADRPDISRSIDAAARTIATSAKRGDAFPPQRDVPATVADPLGRAEASLTDLYALVTELTDVVAERDRALLDATRRADLAERASATAREEVARVEASRQSLAEALGEAQMRMDASRDAEQELRSEVASMREELEFARRQPRSPSLPGASTLPQRSASRARPRSAAFDATVSSSTTAPSETESDPVPAAFVDWCHGGGGLVGEMDRFALALHSRCPGATVRRVHRDSDSPALPVRLTETRGLSPIEYWAASYLGRTVVLPQPLSPSQFREIAPCFEGTAAPHTLSALVPPTVRADGGSLRVEAPGRVA